MQEKHEANRRQDVAAHPHLGRELRVGLLNPFQLRPSLIDGHRSARDALDQVGDVVHLVKPQRCGVGSGSLGVDTVLVGNRQHQRGREHDGSEVVDAVTVGHPLQGGCNHRNRDSRPDENPAQLQQKVEGSDVELRRGLIRVWGCGRGSEMIRRFLGDDGSVRLTPQDHPSGDADDDQDEHGQQDRADGDVGAPNLGRPAGSAAPLVLAVFLVCVCARVVPARYLVSVRFAVCARAVPPWLLLWVRFLGTGLRHRRGCPGGRRARRLSGRRRLARPRHGRRYFTRRRLACRWVGVRCPLHLWCARRSVLSPGSAVGGRLLAFRGRRGAAVGLVLLVVGLPVAPLCGRSVGPYRAAVMAGAGSGEHFDEHQRQRCNDEDANTPAAAPQGERAQLSAGLSSAERMSPNHA